MGKQLTKFEAKARLAKLRALIDHHRYVTHVLDRAEISEGALDSLKHELVQLETQFPDLITPDSPSQRVAGEPLPQFKKVTHTARMFSLEDVFSADELQSWDARWRKLEPQAKTEYVVDLKLDGLAISIRYEHGQYAQAATRGNGFIGEDVTHTVKTMESVPLRLLTEHLPPAVRTAVERGEVIVRGEAVMLKKDFDNLNKRQAKNDDALYANPRNVAAGTIRQLDPAVAAERRLTFYAWELITDLGQTTIAEGYEWLKKMGIKINPRVTTCHSLAEVEKVHDAVERDREKLPFWIDGMVVKINSLSLYRRLGFVGKTPRAAVAWKYSAEQVTTKVEDIVVQVGRTGALTPVAHLTPVQVAGTVVARATLHNADEIDRLGVRIGDTVIIQKAGDIIPEVVEVLTDLRPAGTKPWRMISICPICRSAVKRRTGEVIYYCPNQNCPAKQREGLYHFVAKAAFDIVGLGPSTIDVLIDENLVHEPADLYALTAEQLNGLPLFGEKKSENLMTSIHQRTRITLDRFLYGLGIRHVGAETARTLAAKLHQLSNIMDATVDELAAIPDVGNVVAASIAEYFASAKNRSMIERLLRHVTIVAARAATGGRLAGRSIVVTGTLPTITREDAEAMIRAAGGHPTSSVSGKTHAVVVGDEPGSKADKAKRLGVAIWDEARLRQEVGGA